MRELWNQILVILVTVALALGCSSDTVTPDNAGGSGGGAGAPGASASAGGPPSTGGMPGAAGATATAGAANGGAGGASGGSAVGGTAGSGGSDLQPGDGGAGGMATGGMAAGGMDAGAGGAPDLNIVTGVATMVVRGAGTPTPGDNVMIARVEALGFNEVIVVSDAAVTAESVIGSDLVVISSSAESSPLGDKLKDIEIPVLCVEDAEFPKMAMAPSGTHDDGISDLVMLGDGAPLATELMGTVTISSVPGELGYATPEPAAWIAATMPNDDTLAVVFGYEKGAQMVGMVAPARRAGFAIREVMAANLTDDGIALYDSILRWVLQ